MKDFAPIILFVYDRAAHTEKTVSALLANSEAKDSDLFIYSDAEKNPEASHRVELTRAFIHQISGFNSVTIIERDSNWGLARNVIDGITSVIDKYGKVIVVEDDIITSPFFLRFMNEALDLYADDDRVASVQGYTYPVARKMPETFFLRVQGCWGWGTWKRAWNLFNSDSAVLYDELQNRRLGREFNVDDTYNYMKMLRDQRDGKINSWAIRWGASVFLAGKLALYPGQSLVYNSGFNGSGGTHCTEEDHRFDAVIRNSPIDLSLKPIVEESQVARAAYIDFLKEKGLGKRGKIGRLLYHLHIDALLIGPLRGWRWEK